MTRKRVADVKDSANATLFAEDCGVVLPEAPCPGELGTGDAERPEVSGRAHNFENAIATRSSRSRP